MKNESALVILLVMIVTACGTGNKSAYDAHADKITVAAYYFPAYHVTGEDHLPTSKQPNIRHTSEWELVRSARPRFEGHEQPKVPAWGYSDESDPEVMAKKIDAAAGHGIDVFIFDWYKYEGRSFLNKGLDEGFLKAQNTEKLKFALMWANHDWKEIFPARGENLNQVEVLYPGAVTPEEFDKIGDEIIDMYFTQPNYWLIDGKAYFSIYDIGEFVHSFGGFEATKTAMDELDRKAVEAGLKGVHWNVVAWGNPILQEDLPSGFPYLIKSLGFTSATSYVWIHHVGLENARNDFNEARDEYFAHWDKVKSEYGAPYFPNVTMGWDSSPRTDQSMEWDHTIGYPYTGILVNNTPENFKSALELTRKKLLADAEGPRILNINCWNEWTEGSYLEPDVNNGMKYLEAVKQVFGTE